jgi:hypothetical protein
MTELLYLDDVLDGYPDNTAGLITPVNSRNHVVSTIRGVGFIDSPTTITLPVENGVGVIINPLLLDAVFTQATLWTFDGNNLAVSNYGALTNVTVPAGYTKLAQFVAVLALEKTGGGSDAYQFQFTRNGVGVGLAEDVPWSSAGVQVVTTLYTSLYDISTQDTIGVQVIGVGTGTDLLLHNFEMSVSDSVLLTDPTP